MTAQGDGRAQIREAERLTERPSVGAAVLSVGSIVAALGAASCCVAPFALFMAGVSGAWIADLTALAPYQPMLAAAALGCLGGGFYLARRKPTVVCAEGDACTPRSRRITRIALWTAAVLIAVALGFPKLAPLFL